jgi:hypothetical protein
MEEVVPAPKRRALPSLVNGKSTMTSTTAASTYKPVGKGKGPARKMMAVSQVFYQVCV